MAKIKTILFKQSSRVQEEIEFFKNLDKIELSSRELNNIFQKSTSKNIRLNFNYFNFLQKNSDYKDEFLILDKYFDKKNLFRVRQKNLSIPFNIKNIDYLKDDYIDLNFSKKVSIVLTTFNIEGFVEAAIDSLLNQTYQNIEIILVDDCSTDNTLKILQKFKNLYSDKIQLIKLNKNYGAYIAKNIGITYAKGDLFTFQDADDWAHPQRIEEHVKAHLKNKKIKFSISKLVRLTEDGYFYAKELYPLDRLSMVSLMIDKVLIEQIGYFRKYRLGSDTEYFERLKKFTHYKWERIDKVFMFCSHRGNSLTTSPETGIEGFGKTNKRKHFWNQWHKWHDMLKKARRKPFVDFDRDKYEYEIIK